MSEWLRWFLVRDAVVVMVTIGVWSIGELSTSLEIVRGALIGLCALLFHEYGHLLGAKLSSATVQPAPLWSPFIFNVSVDTNNKEQLLTTSYAGFLATGIFLVAFWQLLPLDRLAGQVGFAIAVLLASLTVLIEFPIAWRIARGYSVPDLTIFTRQ